MQLHLELAEDGVPADINLVPLAFDVAHVAFALLAERAQGGGVADEVVDFILA